MIKGWTSHTLVDAVFVLAGLCVVVKAYRDSDTLDTLPH